MNRHGARAQTTLTFGVFPSVLKLAPIWMDMALQAWFMEG
jgi:hypothetical protein